MLFRIVAAQVGAAKVTPRRRVYRWSLGRLPRTKPLRASLYYAGSSQPSAKLGVDIRNIASASGSPIRMRAGFHNAGTRSPPANGMRPSTVGRPLRSRTSPEIPARFSETPGAAPFYTSQCGLLKQPDKQKLAKLAQTGRWSPTGVQSAVSVPWRPFGVQIAAP